MSTYILIMMFATGTFVSSISITQINLNNKEACLNLAKNMSDKSKNVSFACISKETGEYIVVKKAND